MHAWEQIQKTVDFMEEHLGEEIDIGGLAQLASLSPFYFQRLFRRLVKKPVAEYVKLRRLAKATELLLQKNCRILDIALELGFCSHEHFTRAFKDAFGMTPDEFRKNPQMLNYMTKPELLLHYMLIDEGVPLITEGIVLEINRRENNKPIRFIGKKVDAPISMIGGLGTESGTNILEVLIREFHEQKKVVLGLPEGGEEVGVTLPCEKEGHFSYFAGGMVQESAGFDIGKHKESSEHELPPGFMEWVLPEGEYLVCSLEAENFTALVTDALYKAEKYIFNTWMPRHNLLSEAFCAERYASYLPETAKMEIWLKLVE